MTLQQTWTPLRAVAIGFLVIVFTACGGGGVTDTGGPDPTPVDTTKPPTVQRSSIAVNVIIDPADASLAQLAGFSVAGLTVRLTSSRPADPVRTAVTAANGTVTFENLLEGFYNADVEYALTVAEIARLAPGDRDASVFSAGGQVVLSPPTSSSVDIALVGARRGSVVISEIFGNYGPPQTGTQNYVYGSYLEVYNNGDTTAFLDGMLLFTSSVRHSSSIGGLGPCDFGLTSLRLDSTAIYARTIIQFPGSGQQYPILPGEGKVVAMDALNHQEAAPDKMQQDLSHAHFEHFWSEADIDNPESVNMVRSYGTGAGVFGRGYPYFSARLEYVLMSAGARAAMTEVQVPNCPAETSNCGPITNGRISSEYLLDLVGLEYSPLTPGYDVALADRPLCVPWTAPYYDRAPAPLQSTIDARAIRRRTLSHTADGREILQRTRNSARDFELNQPLQRSLKK